MNTDILNHIIDYVNIHIPIQYVYPLNLDSKDTILFEGNPNIPVWFLEQHQNKVDGYYLCLDTNLHLSFLERYNKRINHVRISSEVSNTDFLERHKDDIWWSCISRNPNLPLWFYEKYLNKLDMHYLSGNPNIPASFWEKHLDKISWYCMSSNRGMSLDFFEENLDKIDWSKIVENPSIPLSFLERHEDISWKITELQVRMSEEFIRKYENRITWGRLGFIPQAMIIPEDILEKYADKIDFEDLSFNLHLPITFLEKYVDRWYWEVLSEHSSIPVEFLEKNLDKVDWDKLSSNVSIPISFFEKNIDQLNWLEISANPSIPLWFFEKYCLQYLDEEDWKYLYKNPSITLEFIVRHHTSDKDPYFLCNEKVCKELFRENIKMYVYKYC